MNFINKVIDSYANNEIIVFSDLKHKMSPEEQIKRAFQANPICFDMGHESKFIGFQKIPELFCLPYDCCWFEGSLDQGDRFGIACNQRENGVECAVFCRRSDKTEILFLNTAIINFVEKQINVGFASISHDKGIEAVAFLAIDLLAVYLSALNCVNVTRQEHQPDAALQKARQKRGKQPLFSYWTLNVDLERGPSSSEQRGGTHASPRVHLRRGHARLLSVGRYVWVQPCVVGSKAAGVVHKEYASA
jgi:hypothetical protein